MNRHRTIVLGSGLRVVGLILNIAAAFFVMPFVVHSLGDRLYGYWALVGALVGYYGLLDLGIVSAVQFQVASALGKQDLNLANRSISTAFFTFSALGSVALLLTVLLAVMAKFFFHSSDDIWLFRKVLLIMGIGFAVGFPGRVFVGAISAHLRWDLIAACDIGFLVARTLVIVAGIKFGGGLVFLAAVNVAADAFSIGSQILILHRIQHGLQISRKLASRSILKQLMSYGGWASIIKIADQLRFYVDGWVVGIFVGISSVTHYAIASRLSLSFMGLIIAVLGILSPWFSLMLGNKDYAGIRRVFSFGTKISASLSTIIAACLLLYGYPFIASWMGIGYIDAFWPLIILVIAVYSDVSQVPLVSYLYGVSKHGFLAKITLGEGLINFGLSIYLARRYGMTGVAIGTLIPMLIAKLCILPVYACRQLNLPLAEYYLRILAKPALFSASVVFFPWILVFRHFVTTNILSVVTLIIAQGILAVSTMFFVLLTSAERSQALSQLFSAGKARPLAMSN